MCFQSLPYLFVGKPERLGQIVSIVSEAARQSLKQKGMHFPPWRKAEYIHSKWLSPFTRLTDTAAAPAPKLKSTRTKESCRMILKKKSVLES
ncbi:hypothetical protein LINPERPRIM_LOCUS36796 [Linum perenne]